MNIESLENRFNQNVLEYYEALQQILILAASKNNYDKELEKILEFYNNKRSNDFDENNLLKSLQKKPRNKTLQHKPGQKICVFFPFENSATCVKCVHYV